MSALEIPVYVPPPRAHKVGPGTTSSKLKDLYHRSLHKGSLKSFARKLLKDGSESDKALVRDWFAHKGGSLEKKAKTEREKTKGNTLAAIRLASKNARRGAKK